MATRKATPSSNASNSGAVEVNADAFPKPARQSTLLSPYADDVLEMCVNGKAKMYAYEGEKESSALSSQLRSLARRNHETALQVVIIPKATPTHPVGVYVRSAGAIKPKPRTNKEAPAKATAAKKTATRSTRK